MLYEVITGAIAEGMQRLGWKRRPHAVHALQAAAAVGQMGLVQCYESCFREHDLAAAQVLLTHADLVRITSYNVCYTKLLRDRLRQACADCVVARSSAGTDPSRVSGARRLKMRCIE